MKTLGGRIRQITEEAGGIWGISLYDLDTKETWSLEEDAVFYAASVIKIPIMIAVYAAHHHRELNLNESIKLRQEDIVGGSGVLQHLTPGISLTIYDLVTLMIIQSDNTATNMLIDLLGIRNIQQTIKDIGMEKSKFYHKMMTNDVDREGLNVITAGEMTEVLKKLATGKIISVYACGAMIDILKRQQLRNSLPAKVPASHETVIGSLPKWELAHKTGNIAGMRHDVGIFYVGNRKLVVSVLTKGLDDVSSPNIISKVGHEIYYYLQQGDGYIS